MCILCKGGVSRHRAGGGSGVEAVGLAVLGEWYGCHLWEGQW